MNASTRLTPDSLFELGFEITGIDIPERFIYGIRFREYHREFEVVIGDYPETNPNVGVVRLYSPIEYAHGVPSDLYRKRNWSVEDHARAEAYRVKIPAERIYLAWYVYTVGRLQDIITSITGKPYHELTIEPLKKYDYEN